MIEMPEIQYDYKMNSDEWCLRDKEGTIIAKLIDTKFDGNQMVFIFKKR